MRDLSRAGIACILALTVAGCASVRQLGSAEIGNSGVFVTGVQVKTKGLKGPDITVIYTAACDDKDLTQCKALGEHVAKGESILNAAVKGVAGDLAIAGGIAAGARFLSRSKLKADATGLAEVTTKSDITTTSITDITIEEVE